MNIRFGESVHSPELDRLRDICGTVTDSLPDEFPSTSRPRHESLPSVAVEPIEPYATNGESMFHLSEDDVALFTSGYESSHRSFLERGYAARRIAGASKLRMAVSLNSIHMVELLLMKGVNPNNQDDKGRSPLHLAAARGFGEVVELLLRNGADPNIEDCRGNIPLHLAVCNSSIRAVTALCVAGSDVLHRGKDGTTPIELSLSRLQAVRKSATVSEARKVAYEQSGLKHFSAAPKPMEKVKNDLEAVLGNLSLSDSVEDGFESQLDGLLTALSGLSVDPGESQSVTSQNSGEAGDIEGAMQMAE
ncbi:unnamed protein product [Notodromas monacha]|uniref:Ankyrin repeat domain-containing protein 54 n=1 Tax=Notodromas monacha TaxID=399045 RepID=A0A7R9GBB4_9CRUS|nr:unnamed protein product [Notodromas monacha]CAG0916321.1 unnamed protein product [Notodromas monacha]